MTFPKMRRAVAIAAMGLAAFAGRAHGEQSAQPAPATPLPEPPASAPREEPLLHLAIEVGGDTPLGNFGLALEVHPFHRLIIAGGLGGHEGQVLDFQAAISARYRLVTLGNASLAAGLGFSRGDRPIQREGYAVMVWREARRRDPLESGAFLAGLSARLPMDGAGVRRPRRHLDPPLRLLLVRPGTDAVLFADAGAALYDQVHTPLLPYAGAGVAANLEKETPGVGPTWYGWQILISDVAAATMLGKGSNSSTVGTGKHLVFYGGLGLWALGGPTIHVVHQRVPSALISFAMRVVPPLVALALAPGLGGDGGRDFVPLFATMGAVAVADWTVLAWGGP